MIDDTWVWRQLAPASSPDPIVNADMIWDGTRSVLFGGSKAAGLSSETWELVGDEWNQLAPSTSPSARAGLHMAWDGSRILLVGGVDGGGTDLSDTWEFAAGDWNELFPANTLPDYNPVTQPGVTITGNASDLIYDGSRFLILYPVFNPTNRTATWQYASSNWSVVAASPQYPDTGLVTQDTWRAAMCWAADRAVAGGGNVSLHNGAVTADNTCEFAAGGWTETVAGGAWSSRYMTRFKWTGDEVALFGGVTDPAGSNTKSNDVWTYDAGTGAWTQITPTGTPPSARYGHAMVWDGTRLIVFGGFDSGGRSDETWVLEPVEPPFTGTASLTHVFGLGR